MEKLDKHQSKYYGPLVIWAGDLADIFSELKDCTDVQLVADNVKFDSVEEFLQESRGHIPSEVKISATNPYLSVDLNARSAWIYVSSSQVLASGLFHKIDSILSRCERKPKFFYRYLWALLASWILPNIFYLTPLRPYDYLSLLMTALTLTWLLYVAFVNLKRFSIA